MDATWLLLTVMIVHQLIKEALEGFEQGQASKLSSL